MRGPLLSGAAGSPATLERVTALLAAAFRGSGERPVVVLSAVWLGEALCEAAPIVLVVEPDKIKAGVRAARRTSKAGRQLHVVVAGEELPLGRGCAAALVAEAVTDLGETDGRAFVAALVPHLRQGGLLLALDRTRDPALEAALARHFLAARLTDVGQERPREGALITIGRAPDPLVVRAGA